MKSTCVYDVNDDYLDELLQQLSALEQIANKPSRRFPRYSHNFNIHPLAQWTPKVSKYDFPFGLVFVSRQTRDVFYSNGARACLALLNGGFEEIDNNRWKALKPVQMVNIQHWLWKLLDTKKIWLL